MTQTERRHQSRRKADRSFIASLVCLAVATAVIAACLGYVEGTREMRNYVLAAQSDLQCEPVK